MNSAEAPKCSSFCGYFKFLGKWVSVKIGSLEDIPVIAAGLWVIHSPSSEVYVSVITMLGDF